MKMDDTWTVFDIAEGYMGNFNKKFIPEIFLRNEVHKDVVENDFKNWLNSYEKLCYPAGDYIYVEENLLDTFSLHLRAFHKL